MALALYAAVSTGRRAAAINPIPAEKDMKRQPEKVSRSKKSFLPEGCAALPA
jgi:hypothetical protein